HTLQVSDTQVLSARAVNETRFRYLRESTDQTSQNLQPTVSVLGAFLGGGNSLGKALETDNRYELQNYTSMSLGKHLVRFGGRLRGLDERHEWTGRCHGV